MSRMSAVQSEAIDAANNCLTMAGLPTINVMLGMQASAVQKAIRPVVLVEIKSVYGALKAYPANEAAELLAQIAGTKTLANVTLALAERMGFSIVQKQPNQLKEIV